MKMKKVLSVAVAGAVLAMATPVSAFSGTSLVRQGTTLTNMPEVVQASYLETLDTMLVEGSHILVSDAAVLDWSGVNKAVSEGGTVTLSGTISADSTITVPAGVSVTLTGGTILRGSALTAPLFRVAKGGSLTLKNITVDGAGVSAAQTMVEVHGTLTVGEGAVLKNARNTEGDGAAIYADIDSQVTLAGGRLTGNETSGHGGAIYVKQGHLDLRSGTIDGNTAVNGNGGGIYLYHASMDMNGGTISGNTASAMNGGGIFCETANLTVTGGAQIKANSAAFSGGGIYISASNNSADGGYSGTVTLDGGASVTGNTTKMNGGAACTSITAVCSVWRKLPSPVTAQPPTAAVSTSAPGVEFKFPAAQLSAATLRARLPTTSTSVMAASWRSPAV